MTPQERDFDFSLSVMISDIIDDCFRFDDEELTRELAKDVANERLKEALTPYSRNVIVQAYIKIMGMPFEEIQEIYEDMYDYTPDSDLEEDEEKPLEEDETNIPTFDASTFKDEIYDHEDNSILRNVILCTERDDVFDVVDENGEEKTYCMVYKLVYEDEIYCWLLSTQHNNGLHVAINCFYQLVRAQNPDDDRLVRVKDEALSDKLKAIARRDIDKK